MMIAAARGAYFALLMLLFGAAAFGTLLKKRLPIIAAVRLPRAALLLAALAAAGAWFVLATAEMADALSSDTIRESATATLFGQIFLVRMALLLALIFVPQRRATVTALLAAAALALPAATSHAAAASPAGFTAIGTILDATHLLTAGFWLGGLAVLVLLFRRREPNILLALSLFSDFALVAVMLLVMTGLIDAAIILLAAKGSPAPLYLVVLGTKLALVAAMLGLAAVNRFKLMPRGADRTIARNAAIELGFGIIVALLAGALGQLQPVL
jgi:putative copper export protein